MKTLRCLLIVAIALPGFRPLVVHAQSVPGQECRYFPETGHHVCDEFLTFFLARGNLEIFGYPLSEAFKDPAHEGRRVQYFQRARMEWHPDNSPAYQVQLGLLIDELGYRFPPVSPEEIPAPEDPAHHYFPETGHVVSLVFLDAFREKGGLDIFGYPRSEFLYEDGKVVQYFQRARMEWDRANVKQPIRLANVGEMYIERFPVPREYLRPTSEHRPVTRLEAAYLPLVMCNAEPGMFPRAVAPEAAQPTPAPATALPTTVPATPLPTVAPTVPPPTPAASVPVTALKVSASVRYPITGRTGTQTVFIYVNDQEERPVEGATAEMVIHYPWGDQDCTPQPTDNAGFTWCSFEITSPTPGEEVVIDIEVAYGTLTERAETFFMPWW
jgi:hypothetical protein